MRAGILCLLTLAVLTALPAAAQPAKPAQNVESLDLPMAGPAPAGDYLPPLPQKERERAAVEMLALVVGGLVVVVIGLRWVTRSRKPEELVTPEQQFVERVHKVLDKVEGTPKADKTDETPRRN